MTDIYPGSTDALDYVEVLRLIRQHMQPGDTVGKMFMRVAKALETETGEVCDGCGRLLVCRHCGKFRSDAPAQRENARLRSLFTKINRLIFANGAPVGSRAYFEIRKIAAKEGEILPEDPFFNGVRFRDDEEEATREYATDVAPVAWRYQRNVGWGDIWRLSEVDPSQHDGFFETPSSWTVQPLYALTIPKRKLCLK